MRRGVELAKATLGRQRARIDAVLAEVRSAPEQAEATMRQAIAEGSFDNAWRPRSALLLCRWSWKPRRERSLSTWRPSPSRQK